MSVSGFSSPVVIDLSGLTMAGTIPLLGDHKSTLDGIAGSGTPTIAGGRLVVAGTLANTPTGQRVKDLAASNVPLQASVGVTPGQMTQVKAGNPRRERSKNRRRATWSNPCS